MDDIYDFYDNLLPKMVLRIDDCRGVIRVESESELKYGTIFHLEMASDDSLEMASDDSRFRFHAKNTYTAESLFSSSSFTFETVKEGSESFIVANTVFYASFPREFRSHQPIHLSTFVALVRKALHSYRRYGQLMYYNINEDEVEHYLKETFFYEGKFNLEIMLPFFYYSDEVFLCRVNKSSELKIESSTLSFPKIIRSFKWLEELTMSQKMLAQIPEEVTELSNLKKLVIDLPRCNKLPITIARLKNLEILQIEGTMINSLNEGVFELTKLKELHLNNNFLLDYIPKSISRLRELEIITIRLGSSYEMKQIMNDDNISEAVSRFDLRITEIPEEITFLPKLKILTLEGQNIKTVPPSLFEMESLVEVNLMHNIKLEREEVYSLLMNSSGRDRIKLII
jgi:hypothetical protein